MRRGGGRKEWDSRYACSELPFNGMLLLVDDEITFLSRLFIFRMALYIFHFAIINSNVDIDCESSFHHLKS